MHYIESLSRDGDLFLDHELIQLGYHLTEIDTVKQTRAITVYLDLIQKTRVEIYKTIDLIRLIDGQKHGRS